MSKRASPMLIGAFTLGAILVTAAALMVLGGGELFRDGQRYVTFFKGSVQGLRVGSNVNFRGVRIGEVVDILVRLDGRNLDVQIPVVIELGGGAMRDTVGDSIDPVNDRKLLAELIERGLRAQLQIDSYVTGQLIVDLDFYPGSRAVFHEPLDELPEIPTVPSEIQAALEKAQSFLARIQGVPVEEILMNVHGITAGIERLVNSPRLENILAGVDALVNQPETRALVPTLKASLERLGQAAGELEKLASGVDGDLEPIVASAAATLDELRALAAEAQVAIGEARRDFGDESSFRYELAGFLRELEDAAHSFRLLAEYLEQHPEALLRGRPDSASPE